MKTNLVNYLTICYNRTVNIMVILLHFCGHGACKDVLNKRGGMYEHIICE